MDDLGQWFSKCSVQDRNLSVAWEIVRNAILEPYLRLTESAMVGGGWGVGSSLCLASTFYDSHAL